MYQLVIRSLQILTITLLLTNCTSIDSRGQFVEDTALRKLQAEKMNQQQVEDLIGSPTVISSYEPNTWYYIQRSLARRAWLEPKIIDQRIVKVKFDARGQTEEVKLLHNTQEEGIKINSEYTKTHGTELNPVQKFVKNIGRFNATTNGSKKHQRKR